MKICRRLLVVAAISVLSGCGSQGGERVAGAALMGGALGTPAGPIGVAVGAGVGAAAGALIPESMLVTH